MTTTLFLVFLSGISYSQNSFPRDFLGHWKGQLEWRVAGKPTQKFNMQLIIKPADTLDQCTWQIIYSDKASDNRPYIIKPIDTTKGKWMIDEGDGIKLDTYIFGNCINGAFTVMGNTIVDNYCVDGNTMGVEFFSIKLGDSTLSGLGTKEVPSVSSYRIGSYQIGKLKRIRDYRLKQSGTNRK